MHHPSVHLFIHSLHFVKASDSIHPHLLEEVYAHWGIPLTLAALLQRLNRCIYEVLGEKGHPNSSKQTQGRGLRTGDPLAPIKFLMLLVWVMGGSKCKGGEVLWETRDEGRKSPLAGAVSDFR